MMRDPVLYDPATDTLLVEVRPWPAAATASVRFSAISGRRRGVYDQMPHGVALALGGRK